MKFIEDESGQGAAEYILLFGGAIVLTIGALIIYRNYLNSFNPYEVSQDLSKVRANVTNKT
ncbi:MAG: class III signal peptide-containing protein [Methanobacterium sp.]